MTRKWNSSPEMMIKARRKDERSSPEKTIRRGSEEEMETIPDRRLREDSLDPKKRRELEPVGATQRNPNGCRIETGGETHRIRHPSVKWAQRSDKLFISIELPDAKDVKLKLDPEGKFFFSATSGADKIPYEIEIDLYDKVDVNESKASVGLRNICYLVKKAEEKWWSRLLKQEGKPPVFLKVDWDKWVDEDEEQEHNFGADMDFGGMGGMGGMDGMDFSKLNMGGGPEDFDLDTADKDEDDSDTEDEEVNTEEAPSIGSEPEAKA
ncbi:hypothetical protein HHK36_030596 [Tetracentron sinense]|uniref:Co-chaperone protein p23 n=1 Tax=Tetracentron sinense TaxID=13715 RepID=A0A834YBY9_TETSI|nr:hypothetical protein HHK36_030596 [Tetracentron sinense]